MAELNVLNKKISYIKIENEDYYIDTEFKKNEFAKFIKTLKNRSIKDFNIDVSSEDSILTLSSCDINDDYRIDFMLDNIEYAHKIGYYNMFESFINDASNFASMGVPSSNQNVIIDENGDPVYIKPTPWIPIIIVSLIVPSIVLLIFINKNKMVKKTKRKRLVIF